jgi:hypothetical protein
MDGRYNSAKKVAINIDMEERITRSCEDKE